ncbi:MAG: amidase [Gammaproteobacteria bacterium]|nr:amidase [Gammaproteobacteria bacterium]
MSADATYAPAVELIGALRAGTTTSTELVRRALARCEAVNPRFNAVIALDAGAALGRAAELDRLAAAGGSAGPLHGLPITVKDCFEVAGLPASNGVPAWRDHRPAHHAEAVRRLVNAGAVVIGKTNVPAYSLDLQTDNELHGRTRNPWDPERTPGGSSGGAAVALATGIVAAEIGSDLAGSLRIPAHFTGVCSLKPSAGVVPTQGLMAPTPGMLRVPDLTSVGPMARTVADLGLLLEVLAGPAPADARAWRLALPAARAPAHALRVAVWLDEALCPVDASVAAVLEAACASLARAGVMVDRQARPAIEPEACFRSFLELMYAEMSGGYPESLMRAFAVAARRPPGEDWTPLTIMPGAVVQSHRDWLVSSEQRACLCLPWTEFFERYDVLLAPVAPTVASAHDEREFAARTVRLGGVDRAFMQQSFWCALATLAGLPAAVVPVGRDPAGLPVGLQIIGPRLEDRTVLECAAFIERLSGGFRPPPVVPGAP